MALPIRYDDYFIAPLKFGVCHFGTAYDAPLEQNTWYKITALYKEMLIRSVKVTSVTAATGASLKFAITSEGQVVLAGFLVDQSIATAVTDTALPFHAGFTTFKPNKFTLGDALENTAALSVKDFNAIELSFQVSGAAPPAGLLLSFEYELAYRA